jgi:hypothetical protein
LRADLRAAIGLFTRQSESLETLDIQEKDDILDDLIWHCRKQDWPLFFFGCKLDSMFSERTRSWGPIIILPRGRLSVRMRTEKACTLNGRILSRESSTTSGGGVAVTGSDGSTTWVSSTTA